MIAETETLTAETDSLKPYTLKKAPPSTAFGNERAVFAQQIARRFEFW